MMHRNARDSASLYWLRMPERSPDEGVDQAGELSAQRLDDVDELLERWAGGDRGAEDQLLELLYPQLRLIASRCRRQRAPAALQTTELIQELYLKLAGPRGGAWANRGHFLAIAVRAIRQILLDSARHESRSKRGGDWIRLSLDEAPDMVGANNPSWLVLDEALTRLGRIDPRALKVVELRFFAGLSGHEAADILGVSRRTVSRRWRFARAWLHDQLDSPAADDSLERGGPNSPRWE